LGTAYNPGGYANPAFDAAVDSGLAALDVRTARAYLRRAFQAVIDDPPAIWLYEPRLPAAVNARLVVAELRPDAWWQSIRAWTVTGPPRPAGAPATTP
jgi:ABC-type transport system substrate-binding protein